MENNVSMSYSVEANASSIPSLNEESKVSKRPEDSDSQTFVNQAAISWQEMRKEWIGDRSKKAERASREPIISWCTTYEDLLTTNQPFPQPIPLSEMIDFLVDIWHEEGLYD